MKLDEAERANITRLMKVKEIVGGIGASEAALAGLSRPWSVNLLWLPGEDERGECVDAGGAQSAFWRFRYWRQ